MRYAPASKLLFIHIPKTAGLSVKDAMAAWSRPLSDELAADLGINPSTPNDANFSGYGEHPVMGSFHVGHVPLPLVRQHLPSSYAIVQQAHPFAVLRNPKERFLSAVAQNLREYKKVGASHISDQMIRQTAREIIDTISGMGMFADRQYIHFAPQSWFVEDAEAPLEVEMFALDRMDQLAAWMAEQSGEAVSFGARNTTVRPKSSYEKLHAALASLGKVLPRGLRDTIRPLILKLPIYRKSSKAGDFAFEADIEAFIEEFYARDWGLYRAALTR